MALKQPASMDECIYFSNRSMGNGKAMAWVFRKDCPKCGAKMGKPIEKGKVKIRADYYECPKCKFKEDKKEHEESLTMSIIYTCPECNNQGETTTQYKRKAWKGVQAYVFECGKCNAKLGITKKLKEPKK
ncbi:MAG: hypothetical protein KJ601_07840 [Nanoarchaeota archaeon]|nr:hypothetical protein [Nanoarchaeota archaeon]MBU1703731.1 hypothetical protein [Nanoarchaeota archaeon]